MKFNLKIMRIALVVGLGFAPRLAAMAVDPDGAVLASVNAMCVSTNLQSMSADDLTSLLTLVDSVNTFFSADPSGTSPAYSGWDATKYSTLKNSVQLALNAKTTVKPVLTVDQQVLAAITAAMGGATKYSVTKNSWAVKGYAPTLSVIKTAIKGLNALATGKLKNSAVAKATSNSVYYAIVAACGANIVTPMYSYLSLKNPTPTQKAAIKKFVAAIKSGGGVAMIASINTLFKNMVASKLLNSALIPPAKAGGASTNAAALKKSLSDLATKTLTAANYNKLAAIK